LTSDCIDDSIFHFDTWVLDIDDWIFSEKMLDYIISDIYTTCVLVGIDWSQNTYHFVVGETI